MTSRYNLSFVDYNRERSNVSLRLEPTNITDNVAAIALETAINSLKAAVEGVSLGLPVSQTRTYLYELLAAPTAAAASPDAQRERKWLVRFYDTVNFLAGSFEIPAADLTLLQANSEYMDISAGAGLALKDAVESYMVSPAGNPVIVFEVVHVGRNI